MNNCFVETSRLLLRRLEEADFPAYAAYAVDDEMSRMMGRAFLHAETDIRQNFDWLKDKEPRCYGIVEKANEQLIGNLNIVALPAPLAAGQTRADAFLLHPAGVPAQRVCRRSHPRRHCRAF